METGLVDLGLTQIRHSNGYQLPGGEGGRVEIGRALVLEPCYMLRVDPIAGCAPIPALGS